MSLSDLHTHTKYCDGKNTAEEMIKSAIDKGFKAIGISGHSYTDFDLSFCMSKAEMKQYAEEIKALKEKYKGQIDVLLGIERDYFASEDDNEYDYIIGSLHYIKVGDKYLTIDESEEVMQNNVNEYFGGDYKKYVAMYYKTIADIKEKTNADIIGHFDLVTKFNEGGKYFDTEEDWYKELAFDALRKIAKDKPLIEVNTGAISRGYRITPYPDKNILREINRLGLEMVINSDSHSTENIGFKFDMAVEILKECGFKTIKILTSEGYEDVAL